MIKSGHAVLVVDSVEDAVKFYSDKLAFDIVELYPTETKKAIAYALLRKGKCYISLRIPHVDELVEFSQVKYCMSRGSGVYAVMKKGLDKFFDRCKKKGVQIVDGIKEHRWGDRTFTVKDPFGFKLTFAEPVEGFSQQPNNFCGFEVDSSRGDDAIDDMARYLKGFGISRRVSKKFAKTWLKNRNK